MVPETKRLLRVLFQQDRIADRKLMFARVPELLGYLLDFVRPGSRYYVFTWRDPRPFFSDLAQMFGKALGRGQANGRAATEPATERNQDPAQGGGLDRAPCPRMAPGPPRSHACRSSRNTSPP
jgi:hypothetical protein